MKSKGGPDPHNGLPKAHAWNRRGHESENQRTSSNATWAGIQKRFERCPHEQSESGPGAWARRVDDEEFV
jgi:hypothetical protein